MILLRGRDKLWGQMTISNAQGIKVMADEEIDDFACGDVSRLTFMMKDGENHTFSHDSTSHWIKVITMILVK